jgi:flavoprotein hydroxylase
MVVNADVTKMDSADVVIVGAGPTGLTAAALLGQYGLNVTVVERWPSSYPRPRAVHFDDETARILQWAGVGSEAVNASEPSIDYEWRNADGQTLLSFDWSDERPYGWPVGNQFHQPTLEAMLERRCSELATVTIRRGFEVLGVGQNPEAATVTGHDTVGGDEETLSTEFVIGADGSNGVVRSFMATSVDDRSFNYDWLIVDILPKEQRPWIPGNLQICDPRRPTTSVSGGPGRRRWEFMRLPHESLSELNKAETAWSLMAPWGITPENAHLERHAVYTFQALTASQWRDGRLLLAGDAAHLMPPFAGQGMCSGLRDAANLAWKLDYVLRHPEQMGLLDTYTIERRTHVQAAIDLSIELGRVICIEDPELAAERDRRMLTAVTNRPKRVITPLTAGLIDCVPDGQDTQIIGYPLPQGHVSWRGKTGLFDDVVGHGFVLLSTVDVGVHLAANQLSWLSALGSRILTLVGPVIGVADHQVSDLDGLTTQYLLSFGAAVVMVRPDRYIFGYRREVGAAGALVDSLNEALDRLRQKAPA